MNSPLAVQSYQSAPLPSTHRIMFAGKLRDERRCPSAIKLAETLFKNAKVPISVTTEFEGVLDDFKRTGSHTKSGQWTITKNRFKQAENDKQHYITIVIGPNYRVDIRVYNHPDYAGRSEPLWLSLRDIPSSIRDGAGERRPVKYTGDWYGQEPQPLKSMRHETPRRSKLGFFRIIFGGEQPVRLGDLMAFPPNTSYVYDGKGLYYRNSAALWLPRLPMKGGGLDLNRRIGIPQNATGLPLYLWVDGQD